MFRDYSTNLTFYFNFYFNEKWKKIAKEKKFDGLGWSGMVWDGLGWSGMVGDGLGWSGMVWDGPRLLFSPPFHPL